MQVSHDSKDGHRRVASIPDRLANHGELRRDDQDASTGVLSRSTSKNLDLDDRQLALRVGRCWSA